MLADMLLIMLFIYVIIALFSVFYTFLEERRRSKEFDRILRQLDADLDKLRKEQEEEE